MIPSSHSGVYGARSPQRQTLQSRITRPVTALLPAVDPAATLPALPAVVPVLTPPAMQSAAWRQRAIELAWETGWQCQATYSGHSARGNGHGSEVYAVPSSQRGHLTYRVTFTPDPHAITIHDGRYVCECVAALHDRPCRHAGAALLLAQARAEALESIEAARAERMSWAWATHHGGNAEGLAFYRVGESAARQWRHVRVVWDVARDVALWCDCGRHVCPHIGAVALRVAKERADALWRARSGYGPDWMDDLLWDGSTLPVALV